MFMDDENTDMASTGAEDAGSTDGMAPAMPEEGEKEEGTGEEAAM